MSQSLEEKDINRVRKLRQAKGFIFLAAFLSLLFSIYLYYSGDTQNGIFVGIWVPSILSAGALLMVGYDG